MATIKITRSDEFLNRMRAIKILANDKLVGTIKNAETKEITLPPGSCMLQAKVDWCKSNPLFFELQENETKAISLSSFSKLKQPGGFTILYYIIFASNKYLQISLQ